MFLTPGYGETPVGADELEALLPAVREILGEPVTRAAVYDLEQALQQESAEELLASVLDGNLTTDILLDDGFVRELHRRLYAEVWTWAGLVRRREYNIGVAPELIAVEMRASIDSIRYRWHHSQDWDARHLGIVAHAEIVRIHPFPDGNGRATRLLADLVFVSAQSSEVPELYNWELDKARYVDLLHQYDQHRDPRELTALVQTQPIEM